MGPAILKLFRILAVITITAALPVDAHHLEALSLQVATPDDAREILKFKGGNNVAF